MVGHAYIRAQRRCSFCGNMEDQVERFIAGPRDVCICDECVDRCRELIDEESSPLSRHQRRAATRRAFHAVLGV